MTNTDRPTFAYDDALRAIADYALALRSDSTATDSTLDDLQYDLDRMLDHDAILDFADDDDDDCLDPDFSTFPSAIYAHLAPDTAATANADAMMRLRRLADDLFNLRP
jgi:hypothetical protein